MVAGDLAPRARVPTGIEGLDGMLSGGLLPGRPYLVVGPPGSGKTTLALQFLLEGARKKENVLYVTLDDPSNEVKQNFPAFRPELERIWVFDATPDIMRYEKVAIKDLSPIRTILRFKEVTAQIRKSDEFRSVEIAFSALMQTLLAEMEMRHYTRLAVDSLTALQYFRMKMMDPNQGAQLFVKFLSDLNVTSLLTVESDPDGATVPERVLCRGEIHLYPQLVSQERIQLLGLEKFRGSTHDQHRYPYHITPSGIVLLTGLDTPKPTPLPLSSDGRVKIGIPGLDAMLGGGLFPGRPYLVSGPTGSGKTLLGLRFLLEGIKRGENALLVAVDETPKEILDDVSSFGWDLSKVHILDANPGSLAYHRLGSIHEISALHDVTTMEALEEKPAKARGGTKVSVQGIFFKLRQQMGEIHFSRVLIDSMTSIKNFILGAGEDVQSERLEIQSLLRFLAEQGVTTLFTTQPEISMTPTTEVLLSRGEIALIKEWRGGNLERRVWVPRMRGMAHERRMHPMEIGPEGITVKAAEG